ncbi:MULTISPECIES: nuclear transport factor 2 family protein [unclassified Colwellia]|uniref:nuclear transport factor 2 family protein n=1 Tax=unclassified Colwellia TaxID=196834 RepID=UPI0015F53577|nr:MULTISPECIES: nuclear transport factor 2 family protein [unclassified Colwellia]MBA6232471.1 nuclear transport factor 2 family protein [Colwellia sp. MB02u-7]MBA6237692.1 nuclear transport factor 2 family protein [Colwellia sp. MB02u-11]MBA6255365.1 nuclear transport factor 2 family protein [Colwellia sp. MB3u-28]MBA6261505.1 nuclear transport factor 2 family protein [Colwellia sp. MB3u-41]MBA6299539.1 nuclear transport factor 2 family protein [Colwellia sp. MB3u-22]
MRKLSFWVTLITVLSLSACGGDTGADGATGQAGATGEIGQRGETGQAGATGAAGTTACDNVGCEFVNKLIVKQIYNDVINGNNIGSVDFIFHEVVRQESIDFYSTLITSNPEHVATVKHIVADGDYVAVHWHYSNMPEDEFTGNAKIDLYKLTEGQITEHKDFSMTYTANTKSGNSVFSDLYDYETTFSNNDTAIEEANKTMVADFYVNAFNTQNVTLIDELVDENYLQHNPFVPDGRSGLRGYVSSGSAPSNIAIFVTLAEDDLVWTFRSDAQVVDLWRVDNNINKIVEHWDVF